MLDINKIVKDFPMLNNKTMQNHPLVYFDNGATTFKPRCVIDKVCDYYLNHSTNAHRGDYELSIYVDKELSETRNLVAKFLNAHANEIVFTSGATQSLNFVAEMVGNDLNENDIILTTKTEHASSILPWMNIANKKNVVIEYLKLDKNGRIDIDAFKKKLNCNVKVVAITYVSNVLGVKNDIDTICKLAHDFDNDIIVSVDGAQSVPHMPTDVKFLDCDFLSFSAHKMCGPTGVGVLYGKYELLERYDAPILGGGSNARFNSKSEIILKKAPFKYESGTPNIEGILGFKSALEYINNIGIANIYEYEKYLHEYMINKLKDLDNIEIYNEDADTAIVTFNVKNVFSQDSGTFFNTRGIAVRSGQHCAKLIGEEINVNTTLRASLYFYNTIEEIDIFVEVCKEANLDSCLDVFF